jgi:hypothetical protein
MFVSMFIGHETWVSPKRYSIVLVLRFLNGDKSGEIHDCLRSRCHPSTPAPSRSNFMSYIGPVLLQKEILSQLIAFIESRQHNGFSIQIQMHAMAHF